ncbi:MAG: tRNA 2-thiouridine(34) synthase MnmA [Candidatus Neomarinimicrobiota bacterium]|nr:MAG: tRNA 2-thiouridine(34) synthase MnmA [Candidatus Neomarinimicrobiota bacterium]
MRNRVIVGLSGGVDSAVAALMLTEAGWDVECLFMKNWEEDDPNPACSSEEDYVMALQVAETLGLPLHTVNFVQEYWDRVFTYFLDEYRRGRTPNPDVLCNREIKFKAFLDYALTLGAEKIATGHYARLIRAAGGTQLWKGVDPGKDQSYFLYMVPQTALERSLFPLGEYTKREVRERARQAGLPNADRKDSTGICFIGERKFSEFLSHYLPAQPGMIETEDHRVVGTHRGLMYYTLGQRQGLGIGGGHGKEGLAWYVVRKDVERNVLVVAQGQRNPALYSRGLEATQLYWINGEPVGHEMEVTAKIRYRQPDQNAVLIRVGEDRIRLEFEEPQFAVAPGQAVVIYQGERCLGGATIERALRPVREVA